ncbi:hypothetical protein ABBQ38_014457 [Trebouxia sp. C0009 RCD-2024]
MSFVQPSTIHAISQSLEVGAISDEAAKALSPDVEYRLREIVQEAQKFMRHSKRRMLTTDDINQALRLKNVQPLYGFGGKDPARFARAAGHQDLLYVHDPELTFEQAVDAPLPKVPTEVAVIPHWLAIEGVQPAIPENAAIQPRRAKRPKVDLAAAKGRAAGAKPAESSPPGKAAAGQSTEQAAAAAASAEGQEASLVRAPVKHVLSQELQLYFDRVALLLRARPGKEASAGAGPVTDERGQLHSSPQLQQQRAVLASLAVDPGLHPLTPYFSQLIAEEGRRSLKSLPTLHLLLKALRSLVSNEAVQLEPYLHQIMPFILTCMVGKRLGASGVQDHWSVREAAARVAALVCAKYGEPYYQIQPRITQALNSAFQQTNNPLTTHYGAIVGLAALGHQAVRNALYPTLQPYLALLHKEMQLPSNEMKRFEAYKCFGALLDAAGKAVRDRVKSVLFPPDEAVQSIPPISQPETEDADPSAQAASAPSLPSGSKQPAAASQPAAAADAMDIDMAHNASSDSAQANQPSVSAAASGPEAASSPNLPHGARSRGKQKQGNAKPTYVARGHRLVHRRVVPKSYAFPSDGSIKAGLADAWSSDSDIGKQLAALYELFGDSILPYVPMLPCLSASV